MVFNNILETIGKTPLIRLNSVVSHIPATVYAKIESFNPGLSAKDRIALHMIERAERLGQLKPGGTVVDATSGNTGFSLAMVCAIKGYKCVLTVTSKISEDKLNNLRAMGAEVHITRSDVGKGHPEYYQDVAARLAQDIPGAFFADQFNNPANVDPNFAYLVHQLPLEGHGAVPIPGAKNQAQAEENAGAMGWSMSVCANFCTRLAPN